MLSRCLRGSHGPEGLGGPWCIGIAASWSRLLLPGIPWSPQRKCDTRITRQMQTFKKASPAMQMRCKYTSHLVASNGGQRQPQLSPRASRKRGSNCTGRCDLSNKWLGCSFLSFCSFLADLHSLKFLLDLFSERERERASMQKLTSQMPEAARDSVWVSRTGGRDAGTWAFAAAPATSAGSCTGSRGRGRAGSRALRCGLCVAWALLPLGLPWSAGRLGLP